MTSDDDDKGRGKPDLKAYMSQQSKRLNMQAWLATIKTSLVQAATYKLDFFLLIIGPALVLWFVKYNIWSSIYHHTGLVEIQGYRLDEMLSYQLWVLIVSLVGQGHNSMSLAEDIRMGRISTYLIYPFDFWKFHSAHFLALMCIQLLVASVCIGFAVWFGNFVLSSPLQLLQGFLLTGIVSCLWFSIQFSIGMVAFWLEESWMLRVMFVMLAQFCSGAFIPLDAYPNWLRSALDWSPFPLLTFIPVQVFMGRHSLNGQDLAVAVFWLGLSVAVTIGIWRRGLRLYSAAGM